MPKGNPKAHGKVGNKGGTGRPPKADENRKTKHVRMSPKLWDKIQIATMNVCENDWHEFLEKVLDGKIKLSSSNLNMRRYEETLFLPSFLCEILRESPQMAEIGGVKTWGKLFRTGGFFVLIENEEVDIWHKDELEDLKDRIVGELRDAVEGQEEVPEAFTGEEVPAFQKILGELNRTALPEKIEGGEWAVY